jgi:hypothetical protein
VQAGGEGLGPVMVEAYRSSSFNAGAASAPKRLEAVRLGWG